MVAYYLAWVGVFVGQKMLFMFWQHKVLGVMTGIERLQVLWHALPLDMSVAGYLTVLMGLCLIASLWLPTRISERIAGLYTMVMVGVVMLLYVVDNCIFPYWGFHIDSTLWVYLRTPKEALASVTLWEAVIGVVAWIGLCVATFAAYHYTIARLWKGISPERGKASIGSGSILLLLTAMLFLPIRGGIKVSTMNSSQVYFSENQMLNLAAVNPVFGMIESLSHGGIDSERYHYMSSEEAHAIVAQMLAVTERQESILREQRPTNIILVVMESFSANGISMLNDGQGVTPCLDRLGEESIVFENAYSSSFRTDRGLVAVLSAFPGQPSMSIMQHPNKTVHLGFFSQQLRQAGYNTHFYYGGDENFTNMRSYLIAGGLMDRVSDVSFPLNQRLSKWGVHDHIVLERAAQTIVSRPTDERHLDIILTESSHEPFEVPYESGNSHPYLNSIAYTDHSIGAFVETLRSAGRWENTLLVLVADHGYPYPDGTVFNSAERYHILMMISGGAIASAQRVKTLCQQTDLVPTILNEMGLSIECFPLSKNILAREQAPWAFYSYNDGFVLMTENDTCRVNGKTGKREMGSEQSERMAKAYMQCVYEAVEELGGGNKE